MSNEVSYWFQDGSTLKEAKLQIPLASSSDFKSCYLFAFPKSGSVLINNLVDRIMAEINVPVVSLSSMLFEQGISLGSAVFDYNRLFKPHGYCYAGFRQMPPTMRGFIDELEGSKTLFVRDPRDMLVSFYFSLRHSHFFPSRGTPQFLDEIAQAKNLLSDSIDQSCINAASHYAVMFSGYKELISAKTVTIMRYEDLIYDKQRLCKELCEAFEVDLPMSVIRDISEKSHHIPGEDDPKAHIRQLHPGDHKRKLKPATIECLNDVLAEFINEFGY